jgi:hypothetical protein
MWAWEGEGMKQNARHVIPQEDKMVVQKRPNGFQMEDLSGDVRSDVYPLDK